MNHYQKTNDWYIIHSKESADSSLLEYIHFVPILSQKGFINKEINAGVILIPHIKLNISMLSSDN